MLARSIIRLCQRRVYVHIGLIEGPATCLFAVYTIVPHQFCLRMRVMISATMQKFFFLYLRMRIIIMKI